MSKASHALWRPTATLDALKSRAALLKSIRQFFSERDVLEVDTPIVSQAASNELHLHSLRTRLDGMNVDGFMHTSPEYGMKRLLCAGSGDIYQMCKVFRDEERGRLHSPEFTMLEWYRLGFSMHELIDEVIELIKTCVPTHVITDVRKISYANLFQDAFGFDPHTASLECMLAVLRPLGLPEGCDHDKDTCLDWAMGDKLLCDMPKGVLVVVYDYPKSQASLACVREGDPAVAERFECTLNGIELANGFHELANSKELRERFEHNAMLRRDARRPEFPIDEHLLSALAHGLPDCSGVALGVDRLLMLATDAKHIDELLSFPIERA